MYSVSVKSKPPSSMFFFLFLHYKWDLLQNWFLTLSDEYIFSIIFVILFSVYLIFCQIFLHLIWQWKCSLLYKRNKSGMDILWLAVHCTWKRSTFCMRAKPLPFVSIFFMHPGISLFINLREDTINKIFVRTVLELTWPGAQNERQNLVLMINKF